MSLLNLQVTTQSLKIKTLYGPHHRPNPKNFFQKGNKRREERIKVDTKDLHRAQGTKPMNFIQSFQI